VSARSTAQRLLLLSVLRSTAQRLLLLGVLLVAPAAGGQGVLDVGNGENVERHLSTEAPYVEWSQDPELLQRQRGDRLEQREVLAKQARTVKLRDVIPPIRFESGVAHIPPSYIQRLRGILDGMRHLAHVRLHLVGHSDDQPLSESLAGVYGDNAGLSQERAGEVAEFLQAALALPPEAISFAWAGDTQPLASNDTAAGRAKNRRVEVEVWHDEIDETVALEEVVVPTEIKRVKVCRVETVCKLRYREGHAHRARVRNLVAPLHYSEDTVGVPDEFVRQIGDALRNLRDKQNVRVRFLGFTDDAPLTGRTGRIYGTHLSFSKAWARRIALAVQDGLSLPGTTVESDGHGASRPLASNETAHGRALNRRIEVEFWHDDPLQELAGEPQPCPDAADAELVTRVYDPPWGSLPSLQIEDGEPVIPPDYREPLLRALADVGDKRNVRLRFVGYTGNERLDRRTARAYGDDIGLSAARARRTMERVQADLELAEEQAEHEGRGYVHANDVVNAGFLQGATSHVVVQVVYDELAVVDDYEGVEITPITRELRPQSPLALNLMRITVDGVPIDDPGRSSADVQRCTDVALERTDIRFRFDGLEAEARLSVTSLPTTVRLWRAEDGALRAPVVRFRTYSNYGHFIERSEVRIFEGNRSVQSEPREIVAVGPDGLARWQPRLTSLASPVRELKYVLRAYDAEGRFDETTPQPLWLLRGEGLAPRGFHESAEADGEGALPLPAEDPRSAERLRGYGESGALLRNIPFGRSGSVQVHGRGVPPEHTVWLAGTPVPVDEGGSFVAEAILPSGLHTVEVAVLDGEGNGELFLRDLELEQSDWFYVGMADFTLGWSQNDGPIDSLIGENASYDYDSLADGRLAFYLNGRWGEDWGLTASADTREGEITEIFSNFMDKAPESLFRRMDPDYHYPTFGDDGTVAETAPTLGKFYVKLNQRENHALWGNFKVGYVGNELARIERGLYGGNLHFQSLSTTRFGERRVVLDGFAADPGTVASREEFRGTGGSLYYLRRQDLLTGSERLRIELRDKDSGLVSAVVNLQAVQDYDIDYIQGRILLAEPLASTVADDLLVRDQGLSGDEAWLVAQYEYTPGFDEIDSLATGGQGQYWINDFVKLGVTANRNFDGPGDSSLYGADLTVRKSGDSWFKLQAGRSEGPLADAWRSDDGGFRFLGEDEPGIGDVDAGAYRADLSIAVQDFFEGGRGRINLYAQRRDAGYSGPGLETLTDTNQYGGAFGIQLTERMKLRAKADWRLEDQGLETSAQELDIGYQLTPRWSVRSGIRNDRREDSSPVVAATQEEGTRTDSVVQVEYDSKGKWHGYSFAQATLLSTGDRGDNRRGGVGGTYQVSDRLLLDGEVSHGDLGPSARLGTRFQESEGVNHYFSYAVDNERSANGAHERRGSLISGSRARLSDSSSVYIEDRYQHTETTNGLARSMGMTLAPSERWSIGANWEIGSLFDRQTDAETRRTAGGASLRYAFEKLQISSGVEYRLDETQLLDRSWSDRTTWLFRNSMKLQLTPDWRLLGKFNHSFSESSLGQFFDGGFSEAVVGYAFRPVAHDRLNALAKYTYFFNVPTADQLDFEGSAAQFLQKSHITSLDVTYDVTRWWSLGGKYAYRLGQVSLDRESPDFFDNSAHLVILRNDFRILRNWEASGEARMLGLTELNERRTGALVSLYRYIGDNFKVGVGYNFTDFSEDLTDLSFRHRGAFFNLIGSL
jgi:flagellar motor protein MotB